RPDHQVVRAGRGLGLVLRRSGPPGRAALARRRTLRPHLIPPPSLRSTKGQTMLNRRSFLLSLSAGALTLAGCSALPGAGSGSAGGKPAIVMGSTNFSEQLLVAELYAQALEAKGYKVTRKFNLGSREIVAPALASGQIDMYPEYLASYLTFLTNDQTKASSDPAKTYAALQEAAKAKNVTALQYAPAQDQNG